MFFRIKNNEEIYEDLGDNTEEDELEQQDP